MGGGGVVCAGRPRRRTHDCVLPVGHGPAVNQLRRRLTPSCASVAHSVQSKQTPSLPQVLASAAQLPHTSIKSCLIARQERNTPPPFAPPPAAAAPPPPPRLRADGACGAARRGPLDRQVAPPRRAAAGAPRALRRPRRRGLRAGTGASTAHRRSATVAALPTRACVDRRGITAPPRRSLARALLHAVPSFGAALLACVPAPRYRCRPRVLQRLDVALPLLLTLPLLLPCGLLAVLSGAGARAVRGEPGRGARRHGRSRGVRSGSGRGAGPGDSLRLIFTEHIKKHYNFVRPAWPIGLTDWRSRL
jgi:hypothetical protein